MTNPNDKAVITAFWIGEVKPDFLSTLIQIFLTWKTHTRKIKYSHNALLFHYTGKVWHSTTTDNPNLCGVIEEDMKDALAGSLVRYKKTIQLECTNEFFAGWLEGERGKAYSGRQNWANVIPFLQPFFENGDRSRNCSEFLARALRWSPYKFPTNCDYILPTDTFQAILPEEVK